MLKRKIYSELVEWKENRNKNKNQECLIIKGPRQVGKSYIVRNFGKTEYKSFYELNFLLNPELKNIFDGNLSSEEILKKITYFFPEIKFIENNTLIFLDEIQVCPNARTAIKFLASDFRFDVISSGSLLGLSYYEDSEFINEPNSLPVGYEQQINMYSLDFEEFLWALGYNQENINSLKDLILNNETIPEVINKKYETVFLEYMAVGGMPEVVDKYARTFDFNKVSKIQLKILSDYEDDISKHAKGAEKVKVRLCYDSIGRQLSKENKKFQYSVVENGQTSKKYGGSVQWLKDSFTVNLCYNVNEPYIPLFGNSKPEQFKMYSHDTGLLLAKYGPETRKLLLQKKLYGNVKGGIFENAIAECLVKKGHKLYYYHPSEFREIEFLVEKNGEVIPIEVKATNGRTISLNDYISEFNPSISFKLINGNKGKENCKMILPHYAFALIF